MGAADVASDFGAGGVGDFEGPLVVVLRGRHVSLGVIW